ncbi:class I adenylate-forming enzyme family protein [Novosphingobium album (ex Liu et al. 2023)]|uniref:Class I adenylate-forming enzyme family protein n=1 Tax=Novosphingobium album (ex Liu et al. 2023) TaxID=3031130 RepID=A0ABT5WUH6_9SPHN|nr:class I adenylate-forming enzyme family protein [Novosphingobium album (ex Liu et al. 2023)]MDE8653560.1 class I adenylate-forming enzyme family protein [Novosphingobium album (ex Liu et al. 2023)]
MVRSGCELLVQPLDIEAGRKALAAAKSRTMWQMLSDTARRYPDNLALVGGDDAGQISRITYAELVRRATGLSAGLARIGVRRGDRVVLWMTNSIEWAISAFAVMRLGAALVPVNTFLKPEEVKYFVTQSGARHLIMVDRFRKLDMPDILGQFCPSARTEQGPGFLADAAVPDLRNLVLFSRSGGKLACSYDFTALENTTSPEALALAERMERTVVPTDLAMIKYTSGSTAFPKGVMMEHGGIVANGALHSKRMTATDQDVYFSSMPFFHAGGSIYGMMSMFVNGGTLVFTEAFNADLAVDLMLSEKATFFVTLLGEEIVQAALRRGVTFPSVRVAGLQDDNFRKVMPNVTASFAAFGLTETYAPCALAGYKAGGNARSGLMLDGNEGRIVDPVTGREQPPGVPGELLVRGNIARGYWNKPDETAEAFDKDGWFRSEDLVSIDEEGFLTWHGRLKLMLKVGGENVSLEEVQRVVESHEGVLQCGAVGVRDARKAEAVAAYVVRAQGHDFTVEELRAWLDTRLARFKMPREIVFIDELPRLGNGKINRIELNQRAQAEFPL